MRRMGKEEWRSFLTAGTRTGKLGTVRPDGSPHVAPVWFALEGDALVFTTMIDSVKAKNIRHDPRVALCVDDETFPFAFVRVEAEASVEELSPRELLPWTTRIARRYVGDERAESYGRRNAVEGEVLVRVPLSRVIAWKEVAR